MTKGEVFATIKEANVIVDEMVGLSVDSKKYAELNESLSLLLDVLTFSNRSWRNKKFSLHLSKRTGHYYVRYAD